MSSSISEGLGELKKQLTRRTSPHSVPVCTTSAKDSFANVEEFDLASTRISAPLSSAFVSKKPSRSSTYPGGASSMLSSKVPLPHDPEELKEKVEKGEMSTV